MSGDPQLQPWRALRDHVDRAQLFIARSPLSLSDAAAAIRDRDAAKIKAWVNEGLLRRPTPARVAILDHFPEMELRVCEAGAFIVAMSDEDLDALTPPAPAPAEVEAPPDLASLREHIQTVDWSALAPHAEAGRVYLVDDALTIAEVGLAMTLDRAEHIAGWLEAGQLRAPEPERLARWRREPHWTFHFLIVQPFVLVRALILE